MLELNKIYSIIYADPPWQYSFSGTRKYGDDDYCILGTDEICNLPIKQISEEDCILFIWMIWNRLEDCLKVIKSWGFTYKSCAFCWVKKNKKTGGWFLGMGGWTRQNNENCLIATKGHPIRISASIHSIVDTPVEEHSKKPDIVRDRIVELVGDLPRIELFARYKVNGWDAWGNEELRESYRQMELIK